MSIVICCVPVFLANTPGKGGKTAKKDQKAPGPVCGQGDEVWSYRKIRRMLRWPGYKAGLCTAFPKAIRMRTKHGSNAETETRSGKEKMFISSLLPTITNVTSELEILTCFLVRTPQVYCRQKGKFLLIWKYYFCGVIFLFANLKTKKENANYVWYRRICRPAEGCWRFD